MNPLCSICFELFTANDKLKTTLCGHIFHPKCLEGWLASSKTCPECRKPCHLENLLAIYINSATVLDIGDSEEPSVLLGQIFNLKKSLTKMDAKMENNVDEIEKLKATVQNLEMMMQEKNSEIASLQNENESLRTSLIKRNREFKQQVQSVATSPNRKILRKTDDNDLTPTSIVYLKNDCCSVDRIVVIVDPSTSNQASPQKTNPKSAPPIDIITLEQPHDEISLLLSEIVQTHKNSRQKPESPTDFNVCFGATAFDFERSDLLSPERDVTSARFDFSIFNIDPYEDPELALALKSSMEEAKKQTSEDKDIERAIRLSIEQANLSKNNMSKQIVESYLLNLLERL